MGYARISKKVYRKQLYISFCLTLLGSVIIFVSTLFYKSKQWSMKVSMLLKYPKMGVSILTYTAVLVILGGAIFFTYFLYKSKYNYAQGVFWALFIVGLLLWVMKQYIINYL